MTFGGGDPSAVTGHRTIDGDLDGLTGAAAVIGDPAGQVLAQSHGWPRAPGSGDEEDDKTESDQKNCKVVPFATDDRVDQPGNEHQRDDTGDQRRWYQTGHDGSFLAAIDNGAASGTIPRLDGNLSICSTSRSGVGQLFRRLGILPARDRLPERARDRRSAKR